MALLLTGCNASESAQAKTTPDPEATERSTVYIDSMDTFIELSAYGSNRTEALAAAKQEILRLNDMLSIGLEDSEISRVNRDGCGTVSALLRVLLPMAAPGIVTALIFVFINAWNEYTISTVLISTASNRPITVGITQFSSFNMIEWQYLFAASLLATIPVVILFMSIEKHLTAGLTSGGVKG